MRRLSTEDRAKIIAGLKAVDFVTLFHEPTPDRLIRLVRPDVLVKGGDWSENRIVGRGYAKQVKRIPLVKGRSTTNVIDRILKCYGRTKRKSSKS